MQFEDDNDMKQGWKILPHLHSLRTARKSLEPDDFDYLVDEMRWIFEEYCLFIRSVSRNRWISHSSQEKFKSSWIAFDSRGYRTDNADSSRSSSQREGRIHEAYCWNIRCEEATDQDTIRQGIIYFQPLAQEAKSKEK